MHSAYLLTDSPPHLKNLDNNDDVESNRMYPSRAQSNSNVNMRAGSLNVNEQTRYITATAESNQMLCDLFAFCAKRLDEHSRSDLLKVMPLDEGRYEIESISVHLMNEYLKQIVNYLVKSKVRLTSKIEQFIKPEEEYMNEYEGMLQKLEAQCRQHISIEQQLKIWAETAQENLEIAEKELEAVKKQRDAFEAEIKVKSYDQTRRNLNASQQQYCLNTKAVQNQHKDRDSMINYLKARVADLEQHVEKLIEVNHKTSIEPTRTAATVLANEPSPLNQQVQQPPQSMLPLEDSSNVNVISQSEQQKSLKRSQRSVSTISSSKQSIEPQQLLQPQNNGSTSGSIRIKESSSNSSHSKGKGQQSQQKENQSHHNQHHHHHRVPTEPVAVQSSKSYNLNSQTLSNYQVDALACLLSNSNKKMTSNQQLSSSNASLNNTKSLASTREDKKTTDKQYLFDKGERSSAGSSSKPLIDAGKSGKNRSKSRPHTSSQKSISSNSSYSATSSQAVLIKAIQQQQIMKQVQSQAVLNRIQSMIHQGQQSQTSSGSSSLQTSSNNNRSMQQISRDREREVQSLQQSSTKRSVSRSKSKHRFRDENGSAKVGGTATSAVVTGNLAATVPLGQKEYNIYTVNHSIGASSQAKQIKASPAKQHSKNVEYKRSLSVDAFSKHHNNSKTSLTGK